MTANLKTATAWGQVEHLHPDHPTWGLATGAPVGVANGPQPHLLAAVPDNGSPVPTWETLDRAGRAWAAAEEWAEACSMHTRARMTGDGLADLVRAGILSRFLGPFDALARPARDVGRAPWATIPAMGWGCLVVRTDGGVDHLVEVRRPLPAPASTNYAVAWVRFGGADYELSVASQAGGRADALDARRLVYEEEGGCYAAGVCGIVGWADRAWWVGESEHEHPAVALWAHLTGHRPRRVQTMLQGAPPLLVREGPAARLEALAIEERWTLQQDLRDEAGVFTAGTEVALERCAACGRSRSPGGPPRAWAG